METPEDMTKKPWKEPAPSSSESRTVNDYTIWAVFCVYIKYLFCVCKYYTL